MSAVVRRALPLLKTLVDAKPKLKKAIIKYASPDLVMAISEIVLNTLKVLIKLTPQQKQRLSRYKKEFRSLAKKNVSVNKKRKILIQKGAGAGIAALLPLAIDLFNNNDAILNFEHIAVNCGLSRVI